MYQYAAPKTVAAFGGIIMVLLAMGLPILVWLVVVAAVVQFDFHGGSWFCLLAIVNFWAILN